MSEKILNLGQYKVSDIQMTAWFSKSNHFCLTL